MFEKVCVSLRLTPFKISIASGCHGSESYHSRRFLSEHRATKGDAMKDREVWRAPGAFLARRTRTKKGMEADDLLCSRNARSQKTLVERAQWKINQPPSLKK